MPKLALLIVTDDQLGNALICGSRSARAWVTRALASSTRARADITVATCEAARRAASPSESLRGGGGGVGSCASDARTAKATSAAITDNTAPIRIAFGEFTFIESTESTLMRTPRRPAAGESRGDKRPSVHRGLRHRTWPRPTRSSRGAYTTDR